VRRPLTVVLVHNRYQQPGGEDVCVDNDARLLSEAGHRVIRFERHNDEIGATGGAAVAAGTVWSVGSARSLAAVLDREAPDVVHAHNTFPLISLSALSVAARRGIPVVQTLHNYRWACAAAVRFRDGHPCDDCIGRGLAWPGVAHACYRGSRPASAVVVAMQAGHRVAGTLRRRVSLFLTPSEHARSVLVRAGVVPAERIAVRFNHVSGAPAARDPAADAGHVLYAGRVSTEKGVDVLVRAAATVPGTTVYVSGDGPERASIERGAPANVHFLGWQDRAEMLELMAGARCVVVPSRVPETFGLVVAEAAALGVPAIASDTGALPEVAGPAGGRLVPPGAAGALAAALADAAGDPEGWHRRGEAARRRYEAELTAAVAYDRLLAAYRRAGVAGA
jgi:glycosyltransferase involved in cell wall biosynthesis